MFFARLPLIVIRMAQERKVFVGGVPQDFTQDDLYATFSIYAGVKKAWLQKCRASDDSSCPPQNHRGFGFVIFHDPRAIDGLLGGSVSRFIGLRNGHQIEVKRAMSSIKMNQVKEENVEPASPEVMMSRNRNKPIVSGGVTRQTKAVSQTKRADPLYVQWPAPRPEQSTPQLEAPWMSGIEGDMLTMNPFSESMAQWPWPLHAQALMTDAFGGYPGLDIMPHHLPVPPSLAFHDERQIDEYNTFAPEKADWFGVPDFKAVDCLLAPEDAKFGMPPGLEAAQENPPAVERYLI